MTAAPEVGEWSAARPGRTLPPGKTGYPFYRRLGGPQGRSGRAENLVPTGIQSRTVQPVAQSLYRLSYPAHSSRCIPGKKYNGLKCSCVLCVMVLFYVVSYAVRAVHKFDFWLFFFFLQTKYLINSEQCVFKKTTSCSDTDTCLLTRSICFLPTVMARINGL